MEGGGGFVLKLPYSVDQKETERCELGTDGPTDCIVLHTVYIREGRETVGYELTHYSTAHNPDQYTTLQCPAEQSLHSQDIYIVAVAKPLKTPALDEASRGIVGRCCSHVFSIGLLIFYLSEMYS